MAATPQNKERLASAGYDMVEGDHGSYLEAYGTAKQASALKRDGFAPQLVGKANVAAPELADVPVGDDSTYTEVARRREAALPDQRWPGTDSRDVELHRR